MLEDSLFESQCRSKTDKSVTVTISAVVHVAMIGILILIPLIQIQAITVPPIDQSLLAPRFDTPKVVEVFAKQPKLQTISRADPYILTAPESIPKVVADVDEPTAPAVGFISPGAADSLGSLLRDVISPTTELVTPSDPGLPPPPPPAPPIVKAEPIRQGGIVQAANLIYQVKPIYPPLARSARLQGVVVMEAVISSEGLIESLRVISGHPLLNQAALDAVRQWKYRPTMLNGEAVEVITTVTVTFTLN
jgi:protein TonB